MEGMYHGIMLVKHEYVGALRQFYISEKEAEYRSDVSAGKVVIREKECPILDSVWLDEPLNFGSAWVFSNGMIEKIPEKDRRGVLQSYGKAASDGPEATEVRNGTK
jgi:hypothetical protein